MAASKLASKERGGRNRAHRNAVFGPDELIIEMRSERRALMRADAVLRCVAVALEYDGWTSDEPDYAEAIAAARDLISQSIERLESHSGLSSVAAAGSEPESST